MEGEKLAEENKTADQEGSSAPSGKNPLLVVLVLVNTLAVCAIGFFQFQNHKKLNSVTTAADVMQQQLAEGEHGGGAAEGGGEHGAPAAGGEHGAAGGAAKEVKTDGLMYPIDPFTANLAQGDGPKRYIRISLVLKFTKDTKKEEVDARKPQISDAIISMLNAKKPEELLKREGKEYLKEEIKTAINNFLIDGHLEDIYYVGFQIN
nr:flagellar basal body-associated FliL family protein [Bacteriovorax sp. HI3]